jgi:hypothetical protein
MDAISSFADSDDPLAAARVEFAAFYTVATEAEAALMDGLISTSTMLTIVLNPPLSVGDSFRDELRKIAHITEQAFKVSREAVRACRTYRELRDADRERIEEALFTPGRTRDGGSQSFG